MNGLTKACVILGAGASHAVHGEGSTLFSDSSFRPPLARDLFDINGNNAYYNVLSRYPDAVVLTQQLAPLITKGEVSIEEKLTYYSNNDSPTIREKFKQIPGYLRDLLYLSSKEYTHTPSSYIELALELLEDKPHDVLFISLNYDDLLESAITEIYPDLDFHNLSQYINNDKHLKVVKLHGSVNWFRQMSNDGNKRWHQVLSQFDISKKINERDIVISHNIHSVCVERGINSYWLYPIVTAPLASKSISDSVCPDSHINAIKEFLSTCQKFLIIGTSGLDDDLLGIINSCLTSSMTYYHIHIVGLNGGADDCSTRFGKGVKAFNNRIIEKNVFRKGFRHYLHNDIRSFTDFRM